MEKLRIVTAFLVRPIVAGEDDEGILVNTEFLETRQQLAYVFIETCDHGGETFFLIGPALARVRSEVWCFHAVAGLVPQLIIGMWNCVRHVEEERTSSGAFDEVDGARREEVVRILISHAEIRRNIELALVLP